MGVRNMKSIYTKLYQASMDADPVKKGDKVAGMHFNPLLHDEVQKVAMEALMKNKLYPTCSYKTETHDDYVMVTCYMTIHDIESSTAFIEINGCSAMGGLDKFGTGQAMSYSRKYAFLNALNLKTGLDNDDGVEAKPFKKIPQKKSGPKHGSQATHVNKDVQEIKSDIQGCKNIYEYRMVKKNVDPYLETALKNKSPVLYKEISDLLETKGDELNRRTNA
tara:strand:+ start:1136 stop:1795 length:660 start_codon:yes stop_codon:yes gene_type:complete